MTGHRTLGIEPTYADREVECPDCGSQDADFCMVWACDTCDADLEIPVRCTEGAYCSTKCANAQGEDA
jgi:hypothetical protein